MKGHKGTTEPEHCVFRTTTLEDKDWASSFPQLLICFFVCFLYLTLFLSSPSVHVSVCSHTCVWEFYQ